MRHLKKIRETDAGPIDLHWFNEFDLFFFLQMLMLYQLKVRHLQKIRETDAGQIKE